MNSETDDDELADLLNQVDLLSARKIRRDADEIRRKFEEQLLNSPAPLASNRWMMQTDDGWVLVLRNDNGTTVSLPSHLKVSLTSTLGGRDQIQVLEGIWRGLVANLKTGFLTTTNPQHGTAQADFRSRVGGPIVIDGITYDKQLTITHNGTTVGPCPATTYAANPVPAGTHVIEIADYPHLLGASYGALGTVWFRIGTSGDRYIHPGRVSAGCITCAPGNWEFIYHALAKARKNLTQAGDVQTQA